VTRKPNLDREHGVAKAIVLPVLLFFLGGFASSQVASPSNTRDQENFRISVEVDLVVLQATVRDREGQAVVQLGQQNFEVFEDGRPQPIRLFRHEDTPVTVGLVIDHSGSMREKLADVTAGAQAFVHSSNPHDQMFVVNFNETVSLGLPIGIRFSDNAEQLGGAIWGAPAREQGRPGPGAENGGTIECHDLCDWNLRAGRSRPESEGAPTPCSGDRWRSNLSH